MKTTTITFLTATLFGTIVSFAQHGTLDTTFNGNGKVLTAFGEFNSSVNSLAIQPDGRIIAAGAVFNHVDSQFGLTRYNTDGSLDTTFGMGGKVVSDFSVSKMSLNSIVLQSDGKIIGGGIIYNNYTDAQFVLARYNSNGTLDTTFETDGIIIGSSFHISSVILQSDGKIIVAGFSFVGSSRNFQMYRYNNGGDVDTSFGVSGIVTTPIGGKDFAHDVALQTDGKIILSGASHNSSGEYNSDFAIVRYHVNGTLDTTFGTSGIKIIDIDDIDEARSVKIQTDGKIVLTGWSYSSSGSPYFYKIMRLLANGNLDTNFGTDGTVITPVSFGVSSESIEIQNDGKIISAGSYSNGGYNDIAMTRHDINGDLDPTFGVNGIVITPFSTTCQANSLALSAGRIIVGGEAGTTGGTYSPDFAVLRYNSGLELSNSEFNYKKNTFTIYPNPVNQTVNLDFKLNESEELSIDLFDINGAKITNLIKGKSFQTGYHSQKLELPEALSKGIYFLNISNGSTASNVKIVK